ncbi:phosphomannomutase, partial [Escherichia coli]|nr:phosphomannomutase [Escherichia coli]
FDSNKQLPSLRVQRKASLQYIERYTGLFDNDMLSRVKVGIYEHSSAGRDIYARIFESLGATVVSLGRTDKFVPIDTEAVSESDRE